MMQSIFITSRTYFKIEVYSTALKASTTTLSHFLLQHQAVLWVMSAILHSYYRCLLVTDRCLSKNRLLVLSTRMISSRWQKFLNDQPSIVTNSGVTLLKSHHLINMIWNINVIKACDQNWFHYFLGQMIHLFGNRVKTTTMKY